MDPTCHVPHNCGADCSLCCGHPGKASLSSANVIRLEESGLMYETESAGMVANVSKETSASVCRVYVTRTSGVCVS